MKQTRKVGRTARGLLMTLLAVTGLAAVNMQFAHAAETVTLSQSTALAEGQTITVTGSGFPALQPLVVIECGNYNVTTGTLFPAGTTSGNCNAPGGVGTATPFAADASGNFSTNLTMLHQWTNPQTTNVISCVERGNFACYVLVKYNPSGGTPFNVPFHFAPTLSVSPNTGLVAGQTVTLTAKDLPSSVSSILSFSTCPVAATYTSPVAGHGSVGTPLVYTPTGVSPTGWLQDYCGSGSAPQGGGTTVASDGSATFNYTVVTGITNSNYTANSAPPACNAGDTCMINMVGSAPPNGTTSATAQITLANVPTVSVSSISGQTGTSSARAGNDLTLSGTNFNDGSPSVDLCDSDGTSNCSTIGTVSSSSNTLSGTVTVPNGATTGSRKLVVSLGLQSASVSLTVLGAPTVTAPVNGGAGSSFNVTGTNWNPSSTTTELTFMDGGSAVGSAVPLTIASTGAFTTSVTVPSSADAIRVVETGLSYPAPPNAGALYVDSPFQVNSNDVACGSGSPLSNCSLEQQIVQSVTGSVFTFSQASGIVTMSPLTLNGVDQTTTGSLQDVTLVDARGSNVGWSLTASLTDFDDGTASPSGNHVISKSRLSATPSCVVDPTSSGSQVSAGSASQSFSGTVALCTSPVGASGGTFTGDAALSLSVPAAAYAGTYTATMTLLVV